MSHITQITQVTKTESEEIRVIKTLFDPSGQLNEEQIKLFLHVAKEKRLDPRMRQICAVPRYNKNSNRTECVIITQIDGFRLIADRTGRYAPGKATECLLDKNGKVSGATAYVKKMTKDGTWHEFGETAFMSEYKAKSFAWTSMPFVMISKCAEAKALRRAFPGDLSGIYGQEEMDQALVDAESKPQVTSKEPEIVDPIIAEDKRVQLEAYVDGNDDVKIALLQICKVNKFSEIKESQVEACRKYAKARMRVKNENKSIEKLSA